DPGELALVAAIEDAQSIRDVRRRDAEGRHVPPGQDLASDDILRTEDAELARQGRRGSQQRRQCGRKGCRRSTYSSPHATIPTALHRIARGFTWHSNDSSFSGASRFVAMAVRGARVTPRQPGNRRSKAGNSRYLVGIG